MPHRSIGSGAISTACGKTDIHCFDSLGDSGSPAVENIGDNANRGLAFLGSDVGHEAVGGGFEGCRGVEESDDLVEREGVGVLSVRG